MTTYTGSTIKKTLSTVTVESMTNGSMSALWELLSDSVSGPSWVGEIADSAVTLADWLSDDQEYDLNKLHDMTHQLADSEVEDYHSTINKRVQELSLWANSDLDEEVESLNSGTGFLTMTDLNTQYLFCAMRGLYSVLTQWAIEELESGSNE
jgi:hypothetical protein